MTQILVAGAAWRSAAFGLALLTLAGCGVNEVPRLEEQVNAAWSEVLNQYQRRADLVPNLVETVEAFARQEREVLEAVTRARASVSQMTVSPEILEDPALFEQFQQNQAALSGALSRLLVVAEQYPELRSNENFLTLQSQLEGTENRIAVARRDYIRTVAEYNTELRTIPGRWIAAIFYPDAEPKPNFTAEPEAMEAPRVEFDR